MKPISSFLFFTTLAFSVVNAPGQPAITSQPRSQSVSLGANVTFSVRGSGVAPLKYQWQLAGVDISGEAANSLILTNVQSSQAGGYTAVISNASGSVTSLVAILQVDSTFTKITAGNIVNDGGASTACAWGDYDNDEWPDLFVNNRDGDNFLYRNKRDGTFERVAAGHLVSNTATNLAGIWGDYDNDGFLDLLMVNGGCCAGPQRNFLYHNEGNGTFSQPSAAAVGGILSDAGGFHGAAWGDYNGDGFLDLFVANFTGTNYLYRNIGGLKFEKVLDALNRPAPFGIGYAEAAWADYDNDGDPDLLLIKHASNTNKTLLYRNDGRGMLTPVTAGPIVSEGSNGSGASWADYNNDGLVDLFVSNINQERNFLYRNTGDGAFEKIVNQPPVAESADTYGVAGGDYDNDGFLDLFVANGAFGSGLLNNSLFRNNGDGSFVKIASGSLANDKGHSFGCAWADYDNDGFLDLFVANDVSFDSSFSSSSIQENNFLYRNNGNANNWLKVRCVGTASNRAAIGAKVRLKAKYAGQERWQLREIASSDGRTGGSLEAHFGLGDATIIGTLRVEWPSGIIQELHDVPVKQHLTITEPARLHVSGPDAFRIQSWKAMTFEIQVSTELKHWSPLTTVTNLTGKLEFADPNAKNHAQRFYRAILR
jgi:hypothetical protein